MNLSRKVHTLNFSPGGKDEISHTNSRLVIPLFDVLCPYLPATWRRKFRCGVPGYENGDQSLDGKENYFQDNGKVSDLNGATQSLIDENKC